MNADQTEERTQIMQIMQMNADQTEEGTQIKHGGMNADHADERRSNRGGNA